MKKKKKIGFLLIKGTTWPYDVIVALGPTKKQLLAYIDRRFKNALTTVDRQNFDAKGHGRTIQLENNALVLWTLNFPYSPQEFGWLVHEIFHTADLMLRGAGLQLSYESDEAFAYQIDWLTKVIFKEFKLV